MSPACYFPLTPGSAEPAALIVGRRQRLSYTRFAYIVLMNTRKTDTQTHNNKTTKNQAETGRRRVHAMHTHYVCAITNNLPSKNIIIAMYQSSLFTRVPLNHFKSRVFFFSFFSCASLHHSRTLAANLGFCSRFFFCIRSTSWFARSNSNGKESKKNINCSTAQGTSFENAVNEFLFDFAVFLSRSRSIARYARDHYNT